MFWSDCPTPNHPSVGEVDVDLWSFQIPVERRATFVLVFSRSLHDPVAIQESEAYLPFDKTKSVLFRVKKSKKRAGHLSHAAIMLSAR
jgi:hypothetical protein